MKQTPSLNKVVLLTGAARRIGAAIAHWLHARGMNVVLHYQTSATEAEQLAAELNRERPDSAVILAADLRHISALPELVKQAAEYWGRLDGLVNNASSFYPTLIENLDEKKWDDLLNTNLKAPFFLAQAAVPFLQKSQGCIINIVDIHAQKPMRDYSVYCISKAGLWMLTMSLAQELSPEIRVNAVAPGAILWPDQKENIMSTQIKEKIIARTALQRAGEPQDIARAVWFLLEEAPYVTGQMIAVDGGRSLFC